MFRFSSKMLCIMHMMLSLKIRLKYVLELLARLETAVLLVFGYVRYNPKSKSVVQVSVLGWSQNRLEYVRHENILFTTTCSMLYITVMCISLIGTPLVFCYTEFISGRIIFILTLSYFTV